MPRYARTLPDRYWWINSATGELVKLSRLEDPKWNWDQSTPYPATIVHRSSPLGEKNSLPITQPWWDYVRAINEQMGTKAGWDAARRNNAGWINWSSNRTWGQGEILPENPVPLPVVEGITSISGNGIENYVKVLDIKNQAARIQTFRIKYAPPDPKQVNPRTHPYLFCHFTSINAKGEVGYAPDGKSFWFPLLAKEDAYVALAALRLDVELPREEPMAEPQLIVDVSRWQHGDPPKPLDFAKMYARGVRSLKVRTGIGNWYTDPQARNNIVAATDAGLKVGAYHVVRPDHSVPSQIDRALSIVAGLESKLVLPWTVDAEVKVSASGAAISTPTSMDKSNIAAITRGVCEELKRRDGRTPELYSNFNYIANFMPTSRDWLLEYPLHISYYYLNVAWNYFMTKSMPTYKYEGDRIPEPYLSAWRAGRIKQPYLLWQGTDNAPGIEFGVWSGNVDVSIPWPGLDYNNLYGAPAPTPEPSDAEKLRRLWEHHPELH